MSEWGYLEWAVQLVLCHIEQGLVIVGPRYIASCVLQTRATMDSINQQGHLEQRLCIRPGNADTQRRPGRKMVVHRSLGEFLLVDSPDTGQFAWMQALCGKHDDKLVQLCWPIQAKDETCCLRDR